MNKREMRYYLYSKSSDGVRYLVNGWRKHHAYWTPSFSVSRNTFKSARSAMASYTRLCKLMPEYRDDRIGIDRLLWEV